MEEVWKSLEFIGYPKHKISNLGKVKSELQTKEKILRTWKMNQGYFMVNLTNKGKTKHFLLHRLLAMTFLPNPDNKPYVNHINAVRTDNSINNLEWVTESENSYKSYYEQGSKNKTSVYMIDKDTKKILHKFVSIANAQRHLGLKNNSGITRCCKGQLKTAYGYIWKYCN